MRQTSYAALAFLMKRSLFPILCVSFILLVSAPLAKAKVPDETQAIVQKLAQIELKDVTSKDKIALKLPAEWQYRDGKQGGVAFVDVNYSAVMGAVYRSDSVQTPEQLNQALNDWFFAEFKPASTQSVTLANGETVDRIEYTGRVGGERVQLMAAIIHPTEANHVVFFAVAPENWFKSYAPVFGDVLMSVN